MMTVVVLIAIIVKHKRDQKLNPKLQNKNEHFLEKELIDKVQELRYDLIRKFPKKIVNSLPLIDETKGGIRTVEWINRSTLNEVEKCCLVVMLVTCMYCCCMWSIKK